MLLEVSALIKHVGEVAGVLLTTPREGGMLAAHLAGSNMGKA